MKKYMVDLSKIVINHEGRLLAYLGYFDSEDLGQAYTEEEL